MSSQNEQNPFLQYHLNAQRIAFMPLLFQAAKVARDRKLLTTVEQARPLGLTPEQVAERCEVSRYASRVLLEACLALELVTLEEGRYKIAPTGRIFLHDPLVQVNLNFVNDVCYQGAFELDASLQKGEPSGLKVFGNWGTIYEGLTQLPPHVQKSWFAFDHQYSDSMFPRAVPLVARHQPAKLLDVGGNTGKWAIMFGKAQPTAKVTLLDHPGQLELAQKNIAAAGLADRIDFHGMDLLDHSRAFPEGYDVVWMSQFLDCFGEKDIIQLLRRARAALAPNGRVFVAETYWDKQPNDAARLSIIGTSLYFSCMANGQSRMYHSDDLKACLAEAELTVVAEHEVGFHTLFECQRATRA